MGTWAGGAATETLCLQNGRNESFEVSGSYEVQGTNLDRSVYHGTVKITPSDPFFAVSWDVGNTYTGSGRVAEGQFVVVSETFGRVVYQIREGGNLLIGNWADNAATEILYR